jgi:hypothetical protein
VRKGGREGGEGRGGWRIVIPMPEAINFVDGRRQKMILSASALSGMEFTEFNLLKSLEMTEAPWTCRSLVQAIQID